jgi:hypothetical protein
MLTWMIRLLNAVLDFFEVLPVQMSDRWRKDHIYVAGKEGDL